MSYLTIGVPGIAVPKLGVGGALSGDLSEIGT